MERMTRQQMVAEFGEPGVQNPMLLDLITLDAASGKVVLAMFEPRPWAASPQQFAQIEEKINRYLGYVLDGFMAQQYPQYRGRGVILRLDCAHPPQGEALAFVEAARHSIEAHGLEWQINLTPPLT